MIYQKLLQRSLIAKGLVYKEGEEKPTPKRKRKPRKNSNNT